MNTNRNNLPRGFTIIELLVVVSIIGLLLALLVPAIGKARDSALQTQSLANLRNMAAAAQTYSASWNDRQLTLTYDDFAQHISSVSSTCGQEYFSKTGSCPPSLILGWGKSTGNCNGSSPNGPPGMWAYWTPCDAASVGRWTNVVLQFPFIMSGAWSGGGGDGFGLWRLPNIRNFNQYVGGKFYDKTFYAPKDKVSLDRAEPALTRGEEYSAICGIPEEWVPSTYGFSPAGMWNPDVFSSKRGCVNFGGRLPPALFRSPSASAAKFPDLKTRMIEIWWLQNKEGPDYNPKFAGGYTPYFFNQCINSAPCTMFYDGHISVVGASDSMDGNAQVISTNAAGGAAQAEPGLFCQRTLNNLPGPWNSYGGFFTGPDGQEGSNFNYDTEVNTSYHIFTVDGVLGRDFLQAK